MKICRDCGNVFGGGTICPECGSVLYEMSEREVNAYNARLKRTVSEQSSRQYGLYSALPDRVLGSVSLFGAALHVLCLLWASRAKAENNVALFSAAGIVLFLAAAVCFLAPKLLWKISSWRIKLMTGEKDPLPSARWAVAKNFTKYTEFALGAMLLLLALIEIL